MQRDLVQPLTLCERPWAAGWVGGRQVAPQKIHPPPNSWTLCDRETVLCRLRFYRCTYIYRNVVVRGRQEGQSQRKEVAVMWP